MLMVNVRLSVLEMLVTLALVAATADATKSVTAEENVAVALKAPVTVLALSEEDRVTVSVLSGHDASLGFVLHLLFPPLTSTRSWD